jgi:hypothetical protein
MKATIIKKITATTIQASNVIICSIQHSNIKRIIKMEVKWGKELMMLFCASDFSGLFLTKIGLLFLNIL